jgi:hypothetical protein
VTRVVAVVRADRLTSQLSPNGEMPPSLRLGDTELAIEIDPIHSSPDAAVDALLRLSAVALGLAVQLRDRIEAGSWT